MNIGWNVLKAANTEYWVKSLQERWMELKETANANLITDADFALIVTANLVIHLLQTPLHCFHVPVSYASAFTIHKHPIEHLA